ncbi:MAG: hypothetical protein L3J76_05500, partial [Candidatus Hydrothermae bacterium]|nr:hypothetical protein [Candidatus Hydrothermae bacterium]
LGVAYANGAGVELDLTRAAYWFYHAGLTYLEQGNREKARKSLDILERIAQQEGVPAKVHAWRNRLQQALNREQPTK